MRTTSRACGLVRGIAGWGAVALAATACTHASRGYIGPPAPLLDRAWVAPSIDARDSLIYEAQASTNIFLLDNLLEREQALRDDREPLTAAATRVVVVPFFRIRQLKDSSAAVRTPSFRPSVRYERHYLSGDTIARTPGSRSREMSRVRDVGYRLEWTHHSNGQAGCFRAGYVAGPTGNPDDCAPGATADTTGVGLNRSNGDFSTTYWGITGFARHVAMHEERERWALDVAVGYQLHRFGLFGDMRDEQRALYGTHRGRLDLSARRRIGTTQGRLDLMFELAEHTDGRITRWLGHVDLSVRDERLLGGGVLMRFLDGQDYYNIGFAQRRSRILVGFLLDPSRLEATR